MVEPFVGTEVTVLTGRLHPAVARRPTMSEVTPGEDTIVGGLGNLRYRVTEGHPLHYTTHGDMYTYMY